MQCEFFDIWLHSPTCRVSCPVPVPPLPDWLIRLKLYELKKQTTKQVLKIKQKKKYKYSIYMLIDTLI